MNESFVLADNRFLLAVIAVGWSVMAALLKKIASSIERKMEENEKMAEALRAEISAVAEKTRNDILNISHKASTGLDETERHLTARMDAMNDKFVTRHEFSLLAVNLQAMVEAIYNHIISTGAKN